MLFFPRHVDGDRTNHTDLRPLICVALGMKVVVWVRACWTLVVLSLFLGCWLLCLSWSNMWLVLLFYDFALIVLVYIFVVV